MSGNPEVFPPLRGGSPGGTGRFAPGLLTFRYAVWPLINAFHNQRLETLKS
jgi:hypothetical protein